jgi:Zn-dependent M28 family amino/carboxypeptidase
MKNFYFYLLLALGFGCKQQARTPVAETVDPSVEVPVFDADSAYRYTEAQTDFGPRVPNTAAHRACGLYLASELERRGATVVTQETTASTYDGKPLQIKNIIASFGAERSRRILLCAHWDSRPFADHDPDPSNHRKAISGANDGAGACGVLLEIARQISLSPPSVGVDIVLFDAEDWGTPVFDQRKYGSGGWCLGSKYWAKNPHVKNYKAEYGILLDMVSAPNAQFYREMFSMQHADQIVNKVWATAQALGFDNYFIPRNGGGITDDHLEVFKYLKIPCIDIIQYDPRSETGFGSYWHTVNDTMENVDRETLRAVGQTVLYVVYNEK